MPTFADIFSGRGQLNDPLAAVKKVNANPTYSDFKFQSPKFVDAPTYNKGFNLQGALGSASKIVPYISNIANAMRRTPRPKAPKTMSAVAPVRVNFSNQMVEAERAVRGANMSADKMLDENTAAAVKATNFVGGIREKNRVAEAEANTNAQIVEGNQRLNANIASQNNQLTNQYQRDQVESQIATQRNQSANLSNAADKFIAQEDQKAAAQLDQDKLGVLTRLWKDSGVYDRLKKGLETKEFAIGGTMGPGDPVDVPGATKGSYVNPTKHNLDKTRMSEMLSFSLVEGGNPMGHDNGKGLFEMADSAYGREKAQGLINEVTLFGQDPSNKALGADERIRKFYSNKNSIAQNFNNTDAVNTYNTSPNVHVLSQQYAKRENGGPIGEDPTKFGFPAKTRYVAANGTGNVFDNYLFDIQGRSAGFVPYNRSNGTKGALPEKEFLNMLKGNNFKDTAEVFNIGSPDMTMLKDYMTPNKNVLMLPPDTVRKPVKKSPVKKAS